jgi:hypothetical protein
VAIKLFSKSGSPFTAGERARERARERERERGGERERERAALVVAIWRFWRNERRKSGGKVWRN